MSEEEGVKAITPMAGSPSGPVGGDLSAAGDKSGASVALIYLSIQAARADPHVGGKEETWVQDVALGCILLAHKLYWLGALTYLVPGQPERAVPGRE